MRWLIAFHLIVPIAPAVAFQFIADGFPIAFIWILAALPFGSCMTLGVWLGMGRSRFWWRLLTSILGVAYLAFWIGLGSALANNWDLSVADVLRSYLNGLIPFGIGLLLFGGLFLLLGRIYRIDRDCPLLEAPAPGRFRFSVLHVLVLMSLVAVILTLLRSVRATTPERTTSFLGWSADDSLGAVVFLLNAGGAAYATLSPMNVKRNLSFVIVVSILSGVVIAFATNNDQSDWWLFLASMSVGIIPTLVELGSLLVVRSCGYRLVGRTVP
jgi:hypothetical protein